MRPSEAMDPTKGRGRLSVRNDDATNDKPIAHGQLYTE